MIEPPQLLSAREHLSRAEAKYRYEDGLFHLEQGLALLEEVMVGESLEFRTVAQNLASTYSTRIYRRIMNLVETDRGLPEPDLEHLFKVILAFDQRSFDVPVDGSSTKITLVRRLIDRYYEGHSPAAKHTALEKLAKLTSKRQPDV